MAKKIMIVDDDAAVVYVVKLVLEHQGYEVVEAYSGGECLDKIREGKPDLVFLDVTMPGINGWGVLRKIKENEELGAIPVVMLTTKPLDAEVLKMMEIKDIADYITQALLKERYNRVR